MSLTRPVKPDTTYHLTRLTRDLQFFLTPGEITRTVILYLLAIAAQRFQVKIHAVCAMSDHLHLTLTDVLGNLPKVMEWFLPRVTHALNAWRDREGAMWCPDEPTYWRGELVDDESVIDAMIYTLANPVEAGIVRKGRQWTGAWAGFGSGRSTKIRIERPDWLFDGEHWPKEVELELVRPEIRGELTDEELYQEVRKGLEEREREIEKERGGRKSFLGIRKAEKMSWRTKLKHDGQKRKNGKKGAKREEEGGDRLGPTVILCKDPVRRKELEEEYVQFLIAHEEARLAFARGERDVEFPEGTYLMKERYNVRCAQAPP